MTGTKPRGRPEYAPTDDEREKVRVLKAGGLSNVAICEAMGFNERTLTKHFSAELDRGTAKVKADLLMARYRSAMGGNVSAQTKMLEQVGAAQAQQRRAPAQPRLGKKEQQQIAAKATAAEGKYAVPMAPKLVVSNG